jgi:broad specificity phosphatase PhoE
MIDLKGKSGKKVILVRHGLSVFNAQGRMQGSSDESLLSDTGKRTADEVGQYLQQVGIHSAVSSPLVRVRQTAEIALSRVGSKPILEFDYELRETELYQWEGQKLSAISKNRPDEFHAFKYDPANFILENNGQQVYPIRDLYHRAGKFWQDNIPRFVEGNNLVVSHGGTIQALINTALGLGPDSHHAFQPSNCGVSCLEIREGELENTHCFVLRQLNNTVPLGEKLPKLKAGKEGVRILYYPVDDGLTSVDLEVLRKISAIDTVFKYSAVNGDADISATGLKYREFNLGDDVIDDAIQRFVGEGHPLKTYLVAAPIDATRLLLKTVSGVSEEFAGGMALQNRMLTVVHHVYSHPVPILQCVNIPVSHK